MSAGKAASIAEKRMREVLGYRLEERMWPQVGSFMGPWADGAVAPFEVTGPALDDDEMIGRMVGGHLARDFLAWLDCYGPMAATSGELTVDFVSDVAAAHFTWRFRCGCVRSGGAQRVMR